MKFLRKNLHDIKKAIHDKRLIREYKIDNDSRIPTS